MTRPHPPPKGNAAGQGGSPAGGGAFADPGGIAGGITPAAPRCNAQAACRRPKCISPAEYSARNGISLEIMRAHCDQMAILRCVHERGRFWLDNEEGEESAIIGVVSADGEPLDLVSWPVTDPEIVSRAHGAGILLGEQNILSPASWAFGGLLRLWSSPLAWLRDQCRGAVILDYGWAGPILRQALGPIVCEDELLAVDVHYLLNPPGFAFGIYGDRPKTRAA